MQPHKLRELVFAARREDLKGSVLGRLGFVRHRPGVGEVKLVDQCRRENVMLANGRELIVREIVSRPQSQACVRGSRSEIGLITAEESASRRCCNRYAPRRNLPA